MDESRESGDLVLGPGEYIHMQDTSKGSVKTHAGPCLVSASGQQRPVIYVEGRFRPVSRLEDAVRLSPVASEGDYMVVHNPAVNGKKPELSNAELPPELITGRKVNIPGPVTFPLWAEQTAEVIPGHHLRYNQYLLVRVYNEEEAKTNWKEAVVKLVTPSDGDDDDDEAVSTSPTEHVPEDLSVGKLLIIRGDQVSFYIPPTGISVVQDDEGNYVRDALTLERLEYCVLVDEDGNKRYEIGPQVVFPAPTEHFRDKEDDEGNVHIKFRAYELDETQGIHAKVVASYKDGDREREVGSEVFITGKDTPIFYPREELSVIEQDDRQIVHTAVAIPKGEARYVMQRATGEIRTLHGPQMFLPDPRKEELVRRILSEKQVQCWYPGNIEASRYNRMLREMASESTSYEGAISEDDIQRVAQMVNYAGGFDEGTSKSLTAKGLMRNAVYSLTSSAVPTMDAMERSLPAEEQTAAELVTRPTLHEPRVITLQTKYQGVPAIDIWTGYAVKVVSKTGSRRVEVGPKTILPDYDESLEVMELSMGKPKTTDKLLKTAYLRVANNKISDLVEVETRDHVRIKLKLSHRVSFEGDPERWFDVENYVKFLCDHVRSVLKGAVKRVTVEGFYESAVDFVRDTVLGTSSEDAGRPGMPFEENGMRIVDIEVLSIEIVDQAVAKLLAEAQHHVVAGNINLDKERRELALTVERERVAREKRAAEHATKVHNLEIESKEIKEQLQVEVERIHSKLQQHQEQKEAIQAREALSDVEHQANIDRQRASDEQRLTTRKMEIDLDRQHLEAEAESVVKRFAALQPQFTEALLALRDSETIKAVSEAWSMNRVVGGASLSDALGKVFANTPLSGIANRLAGNNGESISPKPPTRPRTSA
jgi:major vault protein